MFKKIFGFVFDLRILGLFPIASGLGLGLYGAAFYTLWQAGFPAVCPALNISLLGICTSLGLLAACSSWLLTRWLGISLLRLDPRQALWYATGCDLPWLGLPSAWFIYPGLFLVGQHLSFDVLGQVHWPWQTTFWHLPPTGYLLLLWAGPFLTLPWFLRLWMGVWFFLKQKHARQDREYSIRPVWLGVCAGLFFLGLSLWTTSVYPPTGDEPHYLLMTHSLLQDQDLDLHNNLAQKDYQKFYPAQDLDFHAASTPGTQMISKHFPLLSIVLLPFYALFNRWGAVLFIFICAAAISMGIYLVARRLGGSETIALQSWLLAVTSAPLAIYFDLIYTELPVALILLLSLLAWWQGGWRGALAVAVAAALLPWFYPKYLPLSALLALLIPVTANTRFKHWIGPGVILLFSALGYVAFFYHYYSFGLSKNPYGVFYPPENPLAWRNALGLLIDRDFGILTTAPIFILSLAGLFQLHAFQPRRATRVIFSVLLVQYLLYCSFEDFTGSAALFSRAMIPAAVLLLPLTGFGWETAQRKGKLVGVVANLLVASSVGIAWLCTACPLLRYLSPKLKLWNALGFVPSIFPSLNGSPPGATLLWGLGWLILIFLFVAALVSRSKMKNHEP